LWRFHDKAPVFCDPLAVGDRLPVEATIACTLITVRGCAGTTVTVDTSLPDGIQATDGTTTFSVLSEQLAADDQPTRDGGASAPVCPTCDGTGVDSGAVRKKRNSPRIARAHFDAPPCPDCLGTGELNGGVW
jgi:hypothetical protein